MSVRLVSVDWGTTSLRLKALDAEGGVAAERAGARGILKCGETAFAAVLREELDALLDGQATGDGGAALPVLMSGMIGSRQGWEEAAYLGCPAAPADIAKALHVIEAPGAGLDGFDIRIVPGMDTDGGGNGAVPDVMRGEETQVLGAMILQGISEGTFVIPGTPAKRIIVEGGRITGFRSFMTGELFAALLDHTILGRLAAGRAHDDDGFAQGVATARSAHEAGAGPGDLMNLVFSARTRVLAGGLREGTVASYLSGLLIGAELMSHRTVLAGGRRDGEEGGGVWLIADGVLGERYGRAAELAGLAVKRVEGEIVAAAHWAIAEQAGILS